MQNKLGGHHHTSYVGQVGVCGHKPAKQRFAELLLSSSAPFPIPPPQAEAQHAALLQASGGPASGRAPAFPCLNVS